jgi:hypothetical protein
MKLFNKKEFKEIKLGQFIYSDLYNCILLVECVRFLDSGIVWLMNPYIKKTYPHTIKYIKKP